MNPSNPPSPSAPPAPPTESPRLPGAAGLSARDWLLALLAALAAAALRAACSQRRGFWLDEYYTLRAVEMSLADLVRDRLSMGHSPLYFFYARLGLLAGHKEWMLRLTSVAAVAATVLFTTGLLGALGLRRALPAFWMLAILQPYWINAGTEFRYMMPLIAVAALACWMAVRFAERATLARGAACALAIALMLSLHASAFFIVAGLLIYLWWDGFARRDWRFVWPAGAGVLLALPFFLSASTQKIVEKKIGNISYKDFFGDLSETVFANHFLLPKLFDFHHSFIFVPALLLIIAAFWLARRELLAHGQRPAWRLLAALGLAIPLVDLLISNFLHHSAGPARYLAAFSIPATICLALAWNSPRTPWGRRAFRGALVFLIVIQAAAAALDLGDLHRESIQWIAAHHTGRERILISTSAMNRVAFQYQNFPHPEQLIDLVMGDERGSKTATKEKMSELLAPDRRGFILLYHDKNKVYTSVKELKDDGFFQAVRRWNLSAEVTIMAFIRDVSELPWLQSLPEPKKPWGPASGMQ